MLRPYTSAVWLPVMLVGRLAPRPGLYVPPDDHRPHLPHARLHRQRRVPIPPAEMPAAPATGTRALGAARAAVDAGLGVVSRAPGADRGGFSVDIHLGPRRGRDDARGRGAAADVVRPTPKPATTRD